ncbi:MAG: GTPase Era [Gemmatimonadetes bacterium RBG_16_66_8]|nr:MAG: GTPase Era [Gemmatimonadetes bacterium RBG_16_66_8]
MPRCGTIVLAGRPNAGKSTLLNALVGQQLAITSPKPQSTRQPVVGLRTEGDVQLVFIDPPGLLEPGYLLQEAMLAAATDVLRHADAVLYLHPYEEQPWPNALDASTHPALAQAPKARLLLLTKADQARDRARSSLIGTDRLAVSGVTNEGIPELVSWCRDRAPERPFRYDPDDVSTQPVRFFAAEFVREAAFALLGDELPYAVAVEIDEFREDSNPQYIRATIYVERESQKGMVVGRGGRTIKALGTRARQAIEEMLGTRIFLDLHVKVLRKWRSNASALERFGFTIPAPRRP